MLSQNSFEHYTKLFDSCILNFVDSKNISDLEPILTECVGVSSLPIKQCLFRKKSKKSFSGFDYQSKQADFVYLLYDNLGNVVYVGATQLDKSPRPMQHAKDKSFSLVKVIYVFDFKVFSYEDIIINALKPKYNKTKQKQTMERIFLHTEHYTPLSKETLRLVKIASDLNDLYEQQPSDELKEQVDAAVKAAENAYKIAKADITQRNAGRCLLSETPPIDGTVTYDYKTGIVHIIN